VPVARLGPGQFFGEMSLFSQGQTNASVKATPHEPVEVVTLERGIFAELMGEAQAMREALMRIVQDRLKQNAAITLWGAKGGLRAQASLA